MCIFDKLCSVGVVAEEAFNHPDRPNELYLWGVLQDHRVMAEFLKKIFTGHSEFHPQMVMFILETMVPRLELEVVSAACDNVNALPVTVQNLSPSVNTFEYLLCALEDTAGLEVGGGAALSRNAGRNHNRRNGANGSNSGSGIVNIP